MTGAVGTLSTKYGAEFYVTVEAPVGPYMFEEVTASMFNSYETLLRAHSLGTDSEIYIRLHLSDMANQADLIKKYFNSRETTGLVSLIGQPPASGSKCCLESYHVYSPHNVIKTKHNDNCLSLRHSDYSSIWCKSYPASSASVSCQTKEIFENLSADLTAQGSMLHRYLLRTWIYIKDIDRNYKDFSDARREYFDSKSISKRCWYPASTGIGGCAENLSDQVVMDTLSVSGLIPGQVERMNASGHLCSPYEYNMPFERGLRVQYGDRSNYYISGTASIDAHGNVLFPGNPAAQTLRTLENIQSLLVAQGSGLLDIRILVVYLRDIADYALIKSVLIDQIPSEIPLIIVRGTICRTQWLVEIEGIAIIDRENLEFAPYF